MVLRNHFPWPICHLLHKDKEHLALRNNFRATKKFLIAKFDCTYIKAWVWIFANLEYFLTKGIDVSNLVNVIKETQNYTMQKVFQRKVKKLLFCKSWKEQNTQLFQYVPPGLNRSSWFDGWRCKNYIGIFNCLIYAFQASFGPSSNWEEVCQKLAWSQNYIIFKIIL